MLPVRFSLPLNWSDKRGNLCCLTFTGLLSQTLLLWEIHYGQAEFVPLAFPMLKSSRGHGTKRSPRRIARICKAFGKTFTLSALLSMLNAELLLRVRPGPRCIIRGSARRCGKAAKCSNYSGGRFWISAVPLINDRLRGRKCFEWDAVSEIFSRDKILLPDSATRGQDLQDGADWLINGIHSRISLTAWILQDLLNYEWTNSLGNQTTLYCNI